MFKSLYLLFSVMLLLTACATTPPEQSTRAKGKTVCDSYIVLHMCVQDSTGDGTVDLIFFSDTHEIFMYRDGMKDIVADIMPFHQCAVPLSERMQTVSNQVLDRDNLSFTEELAITKNLLTSYLAAKPNIDACNARFENANENVDTPEEDFFIEEDWED